MGINTNISATGRKTRIVVGLVIGLIGLATLSRLLGLGTTIGAALSLVGLILVGTGLVRVCPLHRLLSIDTSRPCYRWSGSRTPAYPSETGGARLPLAECSR